MSDRAIVGGVVAGILLLPIVAGALLVGGVLAGVLVLAAVVTLVVGLRQPADDDKQRCLRCGEHNAAGNAVCDDCGAQL
ncbi:MAG: hypothetical protein ABEH90_07440 [Halolamina sp.]